MKVVGWVDCWTAPYKHDIFTDAHRAALVECIGRRHYDFGYQDHQNLPYCAPLFDNGKSCDLSKNQWDEIINEAYMDKVRIKRLLPVDVIKDPPFQSILFESDKLKQEFCERKNQDETR